MKVVGLTGITGGMGRRMAEILTEKGYKIKALVRKTSKIDVLKELNVEFVYGELHEQEALNEFVQDIEICFHTAAQVAFTVKEQLYKSNVEGTEKLCKAIVENNPACRLVHCSTISALVVDPENPSKSSEYGLSKYEAEKKVNQYISEKGLKAAIVYPGQTFGPYDRSLIPWIINLLKSGHMVFAEGGEDNAPLIYVDDMCELLFRAGTVPEAEGKKFLSIRGDEIGIHEFVRAVAKKLNLTEKLPEKTYPRQELFDFATYCEEQHKKFGIKGKPAVYRSVVNNYSINFKTYEKYKDELDSTKEILDWEQHTSREFLLGKLDEALERSFI